MRINRNEPDPLLRRIPVYLYDISRQPVLGAVPVGAQVQISKTGNGWTDFAGTWVEDDDGLYYYIATQPETDTNSFMWLKVEIPGAQRVQFPVDIGDRLAVNQADPCKRRFPIYLTDITNTPIPGLDLTTASQVQISKNGGALVDIAGTVAEVGSPGNGQGAYYYEADPTESDTLGYVAMRVFPTGLPNTRYVYSWKVVTPSGGGDPPIVSNLQPPDGYPIKPADPISFDITSTNGFALILPMITLDPFQVPEPIAEDGDFEPKYQRAGSFREAIPDGWHYVIYREGGWTTQPDLTIHAISSSGAVYTG